MGLANFVYIIFVLLIAKSPLSNTWGTDGHYMVCKITFRYFFFHFYVLQSIRSRKRYVFKYQTCLFEEKKKSNFCLNFLSEIKFQNPVSKLIRY